MTDQSEMISNDTVPRHSQVLLINERQQLENMGRLDGVYPGNCYLQNPNSDAAKDEA